MVEVMRITNGNGARVAFDPVGGPAFPKLISALTDQGVAYIYGALSEGDTPIPVLEMIPKMPAVKGYSIRLVVGDEARRKAAVEYVVKGLASGALRPVIDRTFKFDDMVEAHRYQSSGGRSSLPFELTETGVSNMPAPYTGGCQCGAVRYVLTTEPIRLAACHCTECQRQSGSAFGMSMPVTNDSLSMTGSTKQFTRIADSGGEVTGVFCPDCGVRIYHVLKSAPDVLLSNPARLLTPVGSGQAPSSG